MFIVSSCHAYSLSVLVDIKHRDGLIKSSIDVIKIVKFAEITLFNLINNFSNMKS